MNKLNSINITATQLRLVLSIFFIAISAAIVIGSTIGYNILKEKAKATSETVYQSTVSESQIELIKTEESFLNKNEDSVKRAAEATIDKNSDSYQDTILTTIRTVAKRAGVKITNIDFSDNTPGDNSTNTSLGQSRPAGGVSSSSSSKIPVTVTIENPVDYYKFVNFLQQLERGLLQMQISKVSLTADRDAGKNLVNTGPLTIEVFAR